MTDIIATMSLEKIDVFNPMERCMRWLDCFRRW